MSFRILGEHLPGTFAEKVAVPRANVYPAPSRLSPEKAAAFPLVGLTAWRMLVTRAALRPGETVLVHGVGGGVSTFARADREALRSVPRLRHVLVGGEARTRAGARGGRGDRLQDGGRRQGDPRADEQARRGRRRGLGRRGHVAALAHGGREEGAHRHAAGRLPARTPRRRSASSSGSSSRSSGPRWARTRSSRRC